MAAIVAAALALPACGGGGGKGTNAAAPVVQYSDKDIETFPNEGQEHVPVGTVIPYQTDPPTSGPHYPDPAPGGFYTHVIAAGFLVHSMEHGGVIIYYSKQVTKDQLDELRALAQQHPGLDAQVVVVPRDDNPYPISLTAWTHRPRLTPHDRSR